VFYCLRAVRGGRWEKLAHVPMMPTGKSWATMADKGHPRGVRTLTTRKGTYGRMA
jgi:hypothetical protein